MAPGSREGSRSASRREMAEAWMQKLAAGIREVAGFGVHRIGLRGSADRNYGWIGSRGGGKRRSGNDSRVNTRVEDNSRGP